MHTLLSRIHLIFRMCRCALSTDAEVWPRPLTSVAEQNALSLGFDRLRLEVSEENTAAQALYRRCGFADIGAPARRVQGTIMLRTGAIEVDDTLLTWEKTLAREP